MSKYFKLQVWVSSGYTLTCWTHCVWSLGSLMSLTFDLWLWPWNNVTNLIHVYSSVLELQFHCLSVSCRYIRAENFGSRYTEIGNRIGSDERGDRSKGDIISDITGSFVVLLGIFFPSVTGSYSGRPSLHGRTTIDRKISTYYSGMSFQSAACAGRLSATNLPN